MKLNKEKLDQMVEAVMKEIINGRTGYISELKGQREYDFINKLRTILTPFAMEMTDEEIQKKAIDEDFDDVAGFIIGAKSIRDGK